MIVLTVIIASVGGYVLVYRIRWGGYVPMSRIRPWSIITPLVIV